MKRKLMSWKANWKIFQRWAPQRDKEIEHESESLSDRLTLCDPMDYIVHGILQARILEWVVFPFSRRSSQPRDQTQVSCIAGGFFTRSHKGSPQILEWTAYPFSSGSSQPRNQTGISRCGFLAVFS